LFGDKEFVGVRMKSKFFGSWLFTKGVIKEISRENLKKFKIEKAKYFREVKRCL